MAELLQYKCPNCGGILKFDSDVKNLKCQYCDSEINVEGLKLSEDFGEKPDNFEWEDIASSEWEDSETEDMVVYACPSCGGEIIVSKSTGADKCPYCDTPVVIKGKFSGDLRPDLIIPFSISKAEAKEAYYKHLKSAPFLPKVFKDENHIDEMKAIYVPFWLFECDAEASCSYNATRVDVWQDTKYTYTRTSHYNILREGSVSFEQIPVDASAAIPDELTQSVEPFNFDEAVSFEPAYLAGYLADKYTVSPKESIEVANRRVKQSVEDTFRDTVSGYSTVLPSWNSVELKKGKSSYALLPVWVLNTTYKDQKYIFSINGQTGKTAGDLPVDKGRFYKSFFKTSAISTLAAAAIFTLLNYL